MKVLRIGSKLSIISAIPSGKSLKRKSIISSGEMVLQKCWKKLRNKRALTANGLNCATLAIEKQVKKIGAKRT